MTKYIFIKLLSLQTCASSTIKEQMHTDVQSILTVLHWIDTRGMCVVVQFYPYYSKPSTSYKLTKKKPQISLRKILRNKWHHAKVQVQLHYIIEAAYMKLDALAGSV